MIKRLFSFLLLFAVVFIVSAGISPYIRQLLLRTGLIKEEVSIAGTGSMYPTFPKGEGKTDIVRSREIVAWPKMTEYPTGINLLGLNLFSYKLGRGDIVEFDNNKTASITHDKYGEEAGFVKRIIAIAGDSIKLRDGFVYVNGVLNNEPYTAKPRSSYGGDFLPDCEEIKIPEGKYFVMGDNRKASLDSRYDLGLVSEKDIHFVIPWKDQEDYHKTWRDTSNDTSLANSATLDPAEFVKLLNNKRAEKNLKNLKYNPLLSVSSQRRGEVMIKTDDFSIEASKSGVTLEKSIKDSGYFNIIFAEVFTRGYYESQELLDNFFEFPDTIKLLMSKDYEEIGLSAVTGEVNGCPTQVIVVHLGGYKPPNYTNEEIRSWQEAIPKLRSVKESWQRLKDSDQVNKVKLDEFLSLLDLRITNAEKIYNKMKSNQWLTDEELSMAKNDKNLNDQMQKIIDEIVKR